MLMVHYPIESHRHIKINWFLQVGPALATHVWVEDCYEGCVAPNDSNLSTIAMARGIEAEMHALCLVLDGMPLRCVVNASARVSLNLIIIFNSKICSKITVTIWFCLNEFYLSIQLLSQWNFKASMFYYFITSVY